MNSKKKKRNWVGVNNNFDYKATMGVQELSCDVTISSIANVLLFMSTWISNHIFLKCSPPTTFLKNLFTWNICLHTKWQNVQILPTIKNICICVKVCRPGKNLAGKNKNWCGPGVEDSKPKSDFLQCLLQSNLICHTPRENHSSRRYNNTTKRSWVQILAVLP